MEVWAFQSSHAFECFIEGFGVIRSFNFFRHFDKALVAFGVCKLFRFSFRLHLQGLSTTSDKVELESNKFSCRSIFLR